MADFPDPALPIRPAGVINRLVASPVFQAVCARVPILRGVARREGAAIFDVMQGFVQSQMLVALVELRVLHMLADRAFTAEGLATRCNIPTDRMQILLQAGAALGFIRKSGPEFHLARRGAAFLAVPGLCDMVRHHHVLYLDLADPVAFLRGETSPALAGFWPYVFGAGAAADPAQAARYSRLMAESQYLVAQEALAHLSLSGANKLLDVGGGTGMFLRAVRARYPELKLALFDLPAVVAQAALPADIERHAGSFISDPLPEGADVISLVRVLYDHSDATVRALLKKVHAALPPRGRLLVIEPMSGGTKPDPQTDVYFSVYTLAMQTGRTRSAAQITELLSEAGFSSISKEKSSRRFVASVLEARRTESHV